jgi:hypothetical protein
MALEEVKTNKGKVIVGKVDDKFTRIMYPDGTRVFAVKIKKQAKK